jgi:hypothetical protein
MLSTAIQNKYDATSGSLLKLKRELELELELELEMEGMARKTNSTCSNNNQTLNYCCCGMQNQCKDRRDAKIEEMRIKYARK